MKIMDEEGCIICFENSFDGSTACCQQPVHRHCTDEWMRAEANDKHWLEITCAFCRTRVNSREFDKMVMEYADRMRHLPYQEDKVFMRSMKMAWGDRVFWRENDGSFIGVIHNVNNDAEEVFLGLTKDSALKRARMYLQLFDGLAKLQQQPEEEEEETTDQH